MSKIAGAVYDPPNHELPHVAIIFRPDGEVLVARAVQSVEAGEALIQKVFNEFAEKRDQEVRK